MEGMQHSNKIKVGKQHGLGLRPVSLSCFSDFPFINNLFPFLCIYTFSGYCLLILVVKVLLSEKKSSLGSEKIKICAYLSSE